MTNSGGARQVQGKLPLQSRGRSQKKNLKMGGGGGGGRQQVLVLSVKKNTKKLGKAPTSKRITRKN